jgi:hypothetical protein
MPHNILAALLASTLAVAAVSCRTAARRADAAPPAIPPGAGEPLIGDGEILTARALFIAKCAGCHKFYNPAGYSDGEWQRWFAKMSRKARLESGQEELLSRYLSVFRSTAQGPRS